MSHAVQKSSHPCQRDTEVWPGSVLYSGYFPPFSTTSGRPLGIFLKLEMKVRTRSWLAHRRRALGPGAVGS